MTMDRDEQEREAMRHVEERGFDPGRHTELAERSRQQAREHERNRALSPEGGPTADPRQADHERYLAEEQRRFDQKMETVWDTKGLRPDEWTAIQGNDERGERISVLQRLENNLAFDSGRESAKIRAFSQLTTEEREKLDLVGVEFPDWSGVANSEANYIVLRDDKILTNDVRDALGTFFHESRHLDQNHAIAEKRDNPDLEKEEHNQDRLHRKLMDLGDKDYPKIFEAEDIEESMRLYKINELERDARIEEAKCMERYEEYVRGERF